MRQYFQLTANGDLVLQRLHQTCPTDWKVTVTVDEKNLTPFWKVSTAFVHFQKPELLGSDDLHRGRGGIDSTERCHRHKHCSSQTSTSTKRKLHSTYYSTPNNDLLRIPFRIFLSPHVPRQPEFFCGFFFSLNFLSQVTVTDLNPGRRPRHWPWHWRKTSSLVTLLFTSRSIAYKKF